MKFRDGVERDPESFGYLVLTQKEVDVIRRKRKDNPSYKESLEVVKEFNQTPVVFIYKLKLKDLDVNEGFHTEDINYVCERVE